MTQQPPGTFKLNKGTIHDIAVGDPGLKGAVDGAALAVQARIGGAKSWIDHFTTDRHVAGIIVRAIDQAKHGALTRALGEHGGRMVQER